MKSSAFWDNTSFISLEPELFGLTNVSDAADQQAVHLMPALPPPALSRSTVHSFFFQKVAWKSQFLIEWQHVGPGRAIAQAVSRWLLTAAARIQNRV
jgi:hypothetical protein